MGLYWALADYGRSFARPAAWLALSVPLFQWGYATILAPLMPKAGTLVDKYEHAVGMVALGNAVPFVGPLTVDTEIKKFLFCAGDASTPTHSPEGFQIAGGWAKPRSRSSSYFSSASHCAIISRSSDTIQLPLQAEGGFHPAGIAIDVVA